MSKAIEGRIELGTGRSTGSASLLARNHNTLSPAGLALRFPKVEFATRAVRIRVVRRLAQPLTASELLHRQYNRALPPTRGRAGPCLFHGSREPPLRPPDASRTFSLMREIERVSTLTLADFRARYEAPEIPVVIEGGCADYPAVKKWSPAYLKDKLGHENIQFKVSTCHQLPNFNAPTPAEWFARGSSTLAEFIDHVTSGPPAERARRYFTGDERFLLKRRDGQETRDPHLSPLLDDVPVPALLPADRLYTVWGWLSGKGIRTWLHYETNGCHNFNAQLCGEKTCVLYAPQQLPKMRMFKPGAGNPAYNCSEIDVDAPEHAALPTQAARDQIWRFCSVGTS